MLSSRNTDAGEIWKMIPIKTYKIVFVLIGMLALGTVAHTASAATVFRLDMRQLLVSAQEDNGGGGYVSGFGGATHSGRLLVADDADTNMVISLTDAAPNFVFAGSSFPTGGYSIDMVDAELNFDNGQVSGGLFNISLNRPGGGFDVFSAVLTPYSGSIVPTPIVNPTDYQISAELASVSFNGPTFGSVDTSWLLAGAEGTLIQFDYFPGVTHQDANTTVKLDVTATQVPTPNALLAAGPVFICLAITSMMRRRRRTPWER